MRIRLGIAILFALYSQCSIGSNFYIKGTIGGVMPSKNASYTSDSSSILYGPTSPGTSLFSLPNVTWKNSYNSGFDLSAAIGYYFTTQWHSDIELFYQHFVRETKGDYNWREVNASTQAIYASSFNNPISSKSSVTNVYSFLTNGYYDFTNSSKWTPSVGIGIGLAWVNSNSKTGNATLVVDDPVTPLFETAFVNQYSPAINSAAFAWQVKAALAYRSNDKSSLVVQYRLFGTSQLQAQKSNITSNPGTANQTMFEISPHNIAGLLTNVLEIGMSYDL